MDLKTTNNKTMFVIYSAFYLYLQIPCLHSSFALPERYDIGKFYFKSTLNYRFIKYFKYLQFERRYFCICIYKFLFNSQNSTKVCKVYMQNVLQQNFESLSLKVCGHKFLESRYIEIQQYTRPTFF